MKYNIQTLKEAINQTLFNSDYKRYFNPLYETFKPGRSIVEPTGLVVAKKILKNNIVSITIKPDKKWKGFEPGQHVLLGFVIDGKRYNRAFSICSSLHYFDESNLITLFIQLQKNGKVTSFIHDKLSKGDYVYLSQAQGDFTLSKENSASLLISGGVGITPILSILSTYASKKDFVLLYYAKPYHHINEKELIILERNYPNVKIHILSSEKDGRICKNHIKKFCPDINNRQVYICGPEAFIEKTNSILSSIKIPDQQIKYEFFKKSTPKGDVKSVDIKLISRPAEAIKITTDKTILEALEAQNINIKHGCRMGICNQCQCEKAYGQVYNILTKEISDNRKSNIQPCISVPLGDIKLNI